MQQNTADKFQITQQDVGPSSSRQDVGPQGNGNRAASIALLLLKEGIMYALMFGSVIVSAKILGNILDPYKEQKKSAKKRLDLLQKQFGTTEFQLDEYEMIMASSVVNPLSIDNNLDDVMGWEAITQELVNEVLKPLSHPAIFRSSLFRPAKGVLLYGPPGTGKTMLAKGLAKRSNCYFINVTVSSILSKWLGDANRLVKATFTLAQKLQPCILFIDEVDSLLGTRKDSDHEAIVAVKTEFMQLWDGIETSSDNCILVLGATNRPWMVDEAILRRFTLQYELGLPEDKQRAQILYGYLMKHQREMANLRRAVEKQAKQRSRSTSNISASKFGGELLDVDTLDMKPTSPSERSGKGQKAGKGAVKGGPSLPHFQAIEPELLRLESASMKQLVEQSRGFSGSDLAELCRTACRMPLTEALSSDNAFTTAMVVDHAAAVNQEEEQLHVDLQLLRTLRKVTLADFETALQRTRPSAERAGQYYRHMGGGEDVGVEVGVDGSSGQSGELLQQLLAMLAASASSGRR